MTASNLIDLLKTCHPDCQVQIAAGPMVAEDIVEVFIPPHHEETCFIFGGDDPEIMNAECSIIGRLSDLTTAYLAEQSASLAQRKTQLRAATAN